MKHVPIETDVFQVILDEIAVLDGELSGERIQLCHEDLKELIKPDLFPYDVTEFLANIWRTWRRSDVLEQYRLALISYRWFGISLELHEALERAKTARSA